MKNTTTTKEIVGVQYLRGLAALAVVVDHSATTVVSPKYFSAEILGGFLYRGASGVDLFFMISGFIITIVSLDKKLRPKDSALRFCSRRFVRIVPVMWIAILSFAAMKLLGRGEINIAGFARALVLSPVGYLEPVNIWTLRHELIFYTVFALSIWGPKFFRPLLIVWGFSPFVVSLFDHGEFIDKIAYATNVEFFTGAMIGILWLKAPFSFRPIIHPFWVLSTAMLAIMGFASLVNLSFTDVGKTTLAAAFIAPILIFAVYSECPKGALNWFGELLGSASYAIYLFHPHVLTVAASLIAPRFPYASAPFMVALLTISSIAVGILVHIALEQPLLRLLRTPRTMAARFP